MIKASKQRFILNLKLKTEIYQEDILNKRFEIGRQIYNAVLRIALNKCNEMIKTKAW
ncbi:MAG TPA: transposase, partial [Clostridiaceae bacterium]|nr:transposase [Clostridiaceae bacterium]